ncbi:MAG: MCE family protein [Deltaproteobacteria bacterium]|nr:MCE family protein [Deltaproteobacteria bacterium]
MDRNLFQELRVGLFVMAFISLIALAAFVLGGGTEAFSARYKVHAHYVDVQGLKQGAVVRLAGIDVGEVTKVELAERQGEAKNVHVEITLREEFRPKITRDSVAGITGVGVLGDNIVTITVGTPTLPPLGDGDAIITSEPLSFLNYADRATAIVDNAANISKKVDLLLGAEDEAAKGAVGESLTHVEAMLKEARDGGGVLHVLFYDKAAGRKVKDVLANAEIVTSDVADITREIREGDGLAHAIIYGDGGDALAEDLGRFTEEMTGLVADIKSNDSLVHSLLYDPDKARMVDDFQATVHATRSIVESVDEGDGTAGLLVNDPQLYEDLRALLGGAQRNALLRAYVRATMAHAREEDGGAWTGPEASPATGGK